jgi:YD repeat-containing protein
MKIDGSQARIEHSRGVGTAWLTRFGATLAILFASAAAYAQGVDDTYNPFETVTTRSITTTYNGGPLTVNNRIDSTSTMVEDYAHALHEEMNSMQAGMLHGGIFAYAAWASSAWSYQYNVYGNESIIHSCSVPDGVTYSVPFGRYQGAMLGAEESVYDNQAMSLFQQPIQYRNRQLRYGQVGNSQPQWTFEPQGMLSRTWSVTYAHPNFDYYGNLSSFDCMAVVRYAYASQKGAYAFQNAGVEQSCDYNIPETASGQNIYDVCLSWAPAHCPTAVPTKAWSTNGQVLLDASNTATPVLYYPDGQVEVMRSGNGIGYLFNRGGGDQPPGSTSRQDYSWFTENEIDPNGNTTAYRYLPTSNQLRVVDPLGRVTTYQHDPTTGLVTSITKEGPGGAPQVWSMTYQSFTWNPAALFPDFTWTDSQGINTSAPTSLSTPSLLTRLTIPDGRSYTFAYTQPDGVTPNWGALTKVTDVDGAIHTFTYGGQGTPYLDDWLPGNCPLSSFALPQRRMVSSAVYPNGPSGPVYTTTVNHVQATAAPWINKIVTTLPDGSVQKHSFATTFPGITSWTSFGSGGSDNASHLLHSQPLADETFVNSSATTPIQATYYGDMSNGLLWVAWDSASEASASECGAQYPCRIPGWSLLDIRPTQVKHVKGGETWWDLFTYDATSTGIASDTGYRTFGNVTNHAVADDCSGSPCTTPMVQTVTSYKYGTYASYAAPYENLIRLPLSVKVEDGSGHVLTQVTHAYDEYGLASSAQARRDTTYTNAIRGNVTTTNAYYDVAGAKAATSHIFYFDNGIVQKTQNPLDVAAGRYTTTTTSDFRWVPYTSPPLVLSFPTANGWGSGAAGTCTVSGTQVSSCSVTAGGSGYTAAPDVTISGNDGFGATATTTLVGTSVASVTPSIFGCTGVPSVSLTGGGGSGATAAVSAQKLAVYACQITNGGSGYTSQPTFTLSGGGGTGAVVWAAAAGSMQGCSVTAYGSGYTSVPTITITGGGGHGATAVITSLGVIGIDVTNGGSNYTSRPTVNVTGGGCTSNGSGAYLAPTSVGSITVTNGGQGYMAAPPASTTTAKTTTTNALNQSVSTLHDAFTGAVLSVTGVNGEVSCTQYDGLGRVVESAAPGDSLSTQTQCTASSAPTTCYLRDPACPVVASTTVGAGGAGPTAWTAYYPFGLGGVTYNQARTVSAIRDGTSNGHVQVQLVDGLARSIERCSEADPATSSSNAAICSTTTYDNMGRAYQSYVPFYALAMPTAAAAAPSGDQYTETHYDVLGRVTSTQLMKSGVGQLPPVTTAYTGYAAQSGVPSRTVVSTTDANGSNSLTVVDFLGRTIFFDAQDANCPSTGGYCQTAFGYDAAGRLLTVTDPLGNQTTLTYDNLGRKTKTVDPDRGTWTFLYNDNGEPTQQTDARGAVTHLVYADPLNRLTRRDLPYHKNGTTWVGGTSGEEDEITYYDSAASLPATCYSCDDHCSTTTDTCDTATLACTHTGTACTWPDQ